MKDILKYIVPYFLLIIVIYISSIAEIDQFLIATPSIAILSLYYLRIDNPHKSSLNLFSASIILCFAMSFASYLGWDPILFKASCALSALIYLYRFLKRDEKIWIDYVKVIGILVGTVLINLVPASLPAITLLYGFTYILDRFIIRRQMKKTVQIILFSLMALVCVTFVIYGQIKANEAYKNAAMAKAAQEEAMNAADKARQQAQDAAAEAIRQQAIAEGIKAELQECKEK